MKLTVKFTAAEISQLLVDEAARRLKNAAKFKSPALFSTAYQLDGDGDLLAEVTSPEVETLAIAEC